MALRHLELKDPTVNEIEIRTAAERAASVPFGTLAEPMVSLSQVENLLRAATEYAKAQRPIVLHTSSVPVGQEANSSLAPVSPQVAQLTGAGNPGHPGIDIPVPPPVGWAVIRHRAPLRRGWGLQLVYASMATTLVSAAAAGTTNGNPGAVVAVAAGVIGTVAGIAQAVTEHNRTEA